MSAQDAARAVLSLALAAPARSRECARFVLAVDPANEALVETVARAICASDLGAWGHDPDQQAEYLANAKAALAAIAQAAGGAA